MAKWLEGLETAVGGGSGGPKRVKTLRWLLVIGGIGAALMLMNSFLSFRPVESAQQQQPAANPAPSDQAAFLGRDSGGSDTFEAIEQPIENRLKDILEKIVGVGTVDVFVTVDSTDEVIVQQNEKETQQITDENDKNGGKRHITSITKDGQVVLYETSGGEQSPIVTKRIKPAIRGVLIVARGAENATVRRIILDAVEKGASVPVNRISVVPRKQQ